MKRMGSRDILHAVKVQTQNKKKGGQDQHAKNGHEGVDNVMIL